MEDGSDGAQLPEPRCRVLPQVLKDEKIDVPEGFDELTNSERADLMGWLLGLWKTEVTAHSTQIMRFF